MVRYMQETAGPGWVTRLTATIEDWIGFLQVRANNTGAALYVFSIPHSCSALTLVLLTAYTPHVSPFSVGIRVHSASSARTPHIVATQERCQTMKVVEEIQKRDLMSKPMGFYDRVGE